MKKVSEPRGLGKQCWPRSEQSDQSLHYSPLHLQLFDPILHPKTILSIPVSGIFISPEQSSGRAIALPPASVLASALAKC